MWVTCCSSPTARAWAKGQRHTRNKRTREVSSGVPEYLVGVRRRDDYLAGWLHRGRAAAPTDLSTDFGEYHSRIEVEGNVLRYQRNFVIKDVHVPTEHPQELKEFFHQTAADERNQAVLKRSAP